MQFIHKIGSGLVGTNFATTQGGTEEKKFFVLQIAFLGPKFQKRIRGGQFAFFGSLGVDNLLGRTRGPEQDSEAEFNLRYDANAYLKLNNTNTYQYEIRCRKKFFPPHQIFYNNPRFKEGIHLSGKKITAIFSPSTGGHCISADGPGQSSLHQAKHISGPLIGKSWK